MNLNEKTLVLGLGNTMLSDDGLGIYIVRSLAERCGDDQIDFIEASTGGLELLDLITGYRELILIDAILQDRFLWEI